MPAARSSDDIGERLARLETSLSDFREYESKRWHKQDNDLTPLAALPERLTREIGKLHGIVEGRISANQKEIERSFASAIKEALQPFTDDMREVKTKLNAHDTEITELKDSVAKWTGARMFAAWIIGIIVSIAAGLGLASHK